MSSVHVVFRDCSESKKTLRFQIPLKQDNANADMLYSAIAEKIGSSGNDCDFEIVYCGQRINKGMALEALNLTPQSTLFAFKKQRHTRPTEGDADWHKVVNVVHKALKHQSYRKIVETLVNSQSSLQQLIAAVPGLDQDPVILAMLPEPELLATLTHRHNIFKVMQRHPLFGPAAIYVGEMVLSKPQDFPRTSRSNVYSLDQMSDDDDDGEQEGAIGRAAPQLVTASQLAAALAAATSRPSTSAGPSQGGAPGGGPTVITSDFFQQAMVSAQNTALGAQLQQMRDMGITDENVARQALQATNGDLQAALDLIFGS